MKLILFFEFISVIAAVSPISFLDQVEQVKFSTNFWNFSRDDFVKLLMYADQGMGPGAINFKDSVWSIIWNFYPFLKPLNLWKFHKNFKESNSELEASSGFTTQENGWRKLETNSRMAFIVRLKHAKLYFWWLWAINNPPTDLVDLRKKSTMWLHLI